MYKLLIIDDEPLVRRGITTLVDFHVLGIEAVYEAADGQEGLVLFRQHLPDLILVDINMPRMNGLEFAKEVKALKSETQIAVITGYDYFDYAQKALKIGVDPLPLLCRQPVHYAACDASGIRRPPEPRRRRLLQPHGPLVQKMIRPPSRGRVRASASAPPRILRWSRFFSISRLYLVFSKIVELTFTPTIYRLYLWLAKKCSLPAI